MKEFFNKHKYAFAVLGILGIVNIPILSLLYLASYAAIDSPDEHISTNAIFTAHSTMTLVPNLVIIIGSIVIYFVMKLIKRNKEKAVEK